jgi:hypothetical protein
MMFDRKFIQRITKRFPRKKTYTEQHKSVQKQLSVEEHVPAQEAHVEQERSLQEEHILTQWDLTEKKFLTQRGFTPEEVLALFWLRQWYQSGGSDRVIIVRRLEFLRRLVMNGTLER